MYRKNVNTYLRRISNYLLQGDSKANEERFKCRHTQLTRITHLDDWLTVHRSITLVDFQLGAKNSYLFTYNIFIKRGTLLVAQFVEALRYKSEGRGFDSRWCHWNFSLT
jgi:hypothetical protein